MTDAGRGTKNEISFALTPLELVTICNVTLLHYSHSHSYLHLILTTLLLTQSTVQNLLARCPAHISPKP
jgi:hypothetical protein